MATITTEVSRTVCDLCSDPKNDGSACIVCGKDVCRSHSYNVSLDNKVNLQVCTDCSSKSTIDQLVEKSGVKLD
jgi:hypothetical protein